MPRARYKAFWLFNAKPKCESVCLRTARSFELDWLQSGREERGNDKTVQGLVDSAGNEFFISPVKPKSSPE